jgi:hypothetical protein
VWVKLGNGYLNLDNVADAHFLRDNDGTLTATIETVAGGAKHYKGREAESLREALEALAQGRQPVELLEPPP